LPIFGYGGFSWACGRGCEVLIDDRGKTELLGFCFAFTFHLSASVGPTRQKGQEIR
jgi:hypothetical protein